MPIKEKIIDAAKATKTAVERGGRRVFKSREANFEDASKKIADDEAISIEEAQKKALVTALSDCQPKPDEILDPKGEELKKLEAGFKFVLSSEAQKELENDPSGNPDFRPIPISPASPNQVLKTTDYFEKKFDGEVPPADAIVEYCQTQRKMQLIIDRLKNEMTALSLDVYDINTSSFISGNLEQALKDFPEIAADIGMLQSLRQFAERIENQFARRIAWEQTKQSNIEALKNIFSTENKNHIKDLISNGCLCFGAGALAFTGGAIGLGLAISAPLTFGITGKASLPFFKATQSNLLSFAKEMSPAELKNEEARLAGTGMTPAQIKKAIAQINKPRAQGMLGRSVRAIEAFCSLIPMTARAALFTGYNLPKTIIQGTRYKVGSQLNKDLPKI